MLKNKRGSILIFSYIVVASMVAWGAAAMARTLSEQGTSQRFARLATAFQTAEGGLDQALVNLEDDPDWAGTDSAIQVTAGGYYEVDVEDDESGYTKLTITGHYPSTDTTAFGYQQRQIEAMVELQTPSVFQYGLFGDEDVKIKKDITTDSYNSDDGDYEDQEPGDNGDLGTNSIEDDSVDIAKDTTINGQVLVGPDAEDPNDVLKVARDVTITGDPEADWMSDELDLPAVVPPDACGDEEEWEEKTVDDEDDPLSLDASVNATPCYKKLTVTESGSITVAGNVTVYVKELTVKKDAVINADGKPTQLLFQITSSSDVLIENSGVFVGAIYAPDSTISIKKDGEFYGAAVGDKISVDKSCEIHYDEALADVGPSGGGDADALLISWREL